MMAKRHEQDLRLVEGVVSAQLAERDAEIAALKAELAEWQVKSGMYEHSFDEALKDVSYMEADIKALRAQVAELEAWKAMVPVSALLRQYSKMPMGTADYELDAIDVAVWLDAMAPD